MSVRPQALFLIVVLSLIWGSSFILIKKSLIAFEPMQVACLRISIAGLAMLPFLLPNLRRIPRKRIGHILLFGTLNAAIPAFLFATAQTKVSSATSGILNALTPIFTLLLGIIIFRLPFSMSKLIGVLLGLGGAVMLVLYRNQVSKSGGTEDGNIAYTGLIVLATILYGFSGNFLKRYLQDIPGFLISGLAYAGPGLPLLIWLFAGTDFISTMQTDEVAWKSLGAVATLAVLGSALALVLVSWLVQQSNALMGSFITYFIPFVAMIWGWWDGEKIGWQPIVALAIILAGVYLSSKPNLLSKPKRKATQDVPDSVEV